MSEYTVIPSILSNPSKAKRHIQITHSDGLNKSPPCVVCGKIFKHAQVLKDHLRTSHNIYKQQYEKMYTQNDF